MRNGERLFAWLLGAGAALFSGAFVWAPLALADGGRDFAGVYHAQGPAHSASPTVAVTLSVRLHNVSGAAISNAVVELDELPPAPRAQSFPSAVSIPDRGTATIHGTFTVRSSDAKRWLSGIPPTPTLVVITADRTGRVGRRNVELINSPGALQ